MNPQYVRIWQSLNLDDPGTLVGAVGAVIIAIAITFVLDENPRRLYTSVGLWAGIILGLVVWAIAHLTGISPIDIMRAISGG